jgi:FkbM family methyltransferase
MSALVRFAPPPLVERALRFLDDKIAQPLSANGWELSVIAPSADVFSVEKHAHARIAPDTGPSSVPRAIGLIRSFLEDIKARGFAPRGLLDIGANVGDWTRMALSIFPDLRFVLIEPQREMRASLESLAERPGCFFINAAAGPKSGHMVQTIWEDLGGSSFLPPVEEELLRSGRQRLTKIMTIDEALQQECGGFQPDLVKIDVQGFELAVLAGAKQLFDCVELFIIETSLFEFMPGQPLTRDVINFMTQRGYEFYDVTEYGRRPFDGALGQIDLAFVKAKGFFRNSNAW